MCSHGYLNLHESMVKYGYYLVNVSVFQNTRDNTLLEELICYTWKGYQPVVFCRCLVTVHWHNCLPSFLWKLMKTCLYTHYRSRIANKIFHCHFGRNWESAPVVLSFSYQQSDLQPKWILMGETINSNKTDLMKCGDNKIQINNHY